MSYQVLARKYRPQAFSEVVGQQHVTQTLSNALASGRLHHAYIFAGARGIGKTTVARILAKALNCESRNGSEPCGKCAACTEITEGSSLDVQEIDGASNTSVEDIREIRERVKYMPSSGHYKIYIIDEVHMLSNSAFNALLKTLEEPPAHVIFIFATTESHKIPATILSRCQRYDFRRISPELIADTLTRIAGDESVDIDSDAIRLIAGEATGSLRDAESLFDQAIAFAGDKVTASTIQSMLGFLDREMLFGLADALIEGDPKRALETLDDLFKNGADLVRFGMDVLEVLRHMLVLSECGDVGAVSGLLPHEVERLKEISAKSSAPAIHQMFNSWYGVAERVARTPFPKMLLEVGLIRLARIGDFRGLDDVMAKLDAVLEGVEDDPLKPTTVAKTNVVEKAADPIPVELGDAPHPTFESVARPDLAVSEKRWQEFMRWLVARSPQIASIFSNGIFEGMDEGVLKVSFDSALYADMLMEESRSNQVDGFMNEFFKQKIRLEVGKSAARVKVVDKREQKREMTREVLSSDVVKQAADILGAQLHEVKVEGDK
jgi:DNA polymerase III subunit gamma/tau